MSKSLTKYMYLNLNCVGVRPLYNLPKRGRNGLKLDGGTQEKPTVVLAVSNFYKP
jgi:hypothetical protein